MKPAVPEIRFYRVNRPYGWMSNYSLHAIHLDDREWPTAEHYFQAMKYEDRDHQEVIRQDRDHQEVIRQARTPGEAKRIGHRGRLREDWEGVKDLVMLQTVAAKFDQHPDLAEKLLETGNADLIEDAPRDYYWGCGRRGNGKNMLGRILEEVRNALKEKVASRRQ